jgi:hypothetical protein
MALDMLLRQELFTGRQRKTRGVLTRRSLLSEVSELGTPASC